MRLARILLTLIVAVLGAATIALWPAPSARFLVGALVFLYFLREVGPRLLRKSSPTVVTPLSTSDAARSDVPPASVGRPIADVESFLEDLVARGFSPKGILDVRANRGDWTRMARERFPRSRALLIEPKPRWSPC